MGLDPFESGLQDLSNGYSYASNNIRSREILPNQFDVGCTNLKSELGVRSCASLLCNLDVQTDWLTH
jgi:hypothetical protein